MANPEYLSTPVIVPLPTEIDIANGAAVGQQLCAAFSPGVTIVIADMTATVFCDSSGISQLVLAHHCAAAHRAQLRLVVPLDQVRGHCCIGRSRMAGDWWGDCAPYDLCLRRLPVPA